jgi:aminobenzoyl-glutamate transport protein
MLPYALGFIGVSGSVMADSAFIVIPPLAAPGDGSRRSRRGG